MKDHLVQVVTSSANDIESRAAISYGALLSGITLANAGLGIVHGLASPIGSYYEIPHGVVCGTLIGVATRINIKRLREEEKVNRSHLEKYAKIGRLLSDNICLDMNACCDYLVNQIDNWIELLNMPRLGNYGFQESDVEKVVTVTGQKNNPVKLTDEDIMRIVRERI
jgi:alcohol dehydrogenase class IV